MSKISKALDIGVDEEEKETVLTHDDHLEAILFQFVNLYERWSEDRQVTAKQSADLAKFVKAFANQVDKFSTLEEQVRNDIQKSIRTEAENTAVFFSKTIGEAAREKVEPTVRKLHDAVEESTEALSAYRSSTGANKKNSPQTRIYCAWVIMKDHIESYVGNRLDSGHE